MTPMNKLKSHPDHVRAVVYARQSKKREDDSRVSPEAQISKCQALITAKGWHPSGTFQDIGKSGWDPDVHRPEFEEMMTAVRAGEIDAVVIFMLSRLTRKGALDAMMIQQELAEHGVLLVSVEEPYLDTSTPMGVAIFGLIAALAQQESDMKSAYQTATKETLRQAGSHIGGPAPYGFRSIPVTRNGVTVRQLIPNEDQAIFVRIMVEQALTGRTTGSIAAELTAKKVPTALSVASAVMMARRSRTHSVALDNPVWYGSNVRRLLRDPRLAGYAIVGKGYKAEILYKDGEPLRAHEGIVEPAVWWQLQDVLNGRTYMPRKGAKSVPTLLAGMGVLRCGVCGNAMLAGISRGIRHYACKRPAGAVEGHGGLSARMDVVDDVVTRKVWARLDALDPMDEDDREFLAEVAKRYASQQDSSERLAELAAARAELGHVQAALRTLYKDREDGLYEGPTGRASFVEAVARLTTHEAATGGRVASLEAAGSEAVAIPAEWTEPGEDPIGEGSLWAAWDLTRRREFIRLFVDEVRIGPAVGRGITADTRRRIQVKWAGVQR